MKKRKLSELSISDKITIYANYLPDKKRSVCERFNITKCALSKIMIEINEFLNYNDNC